MRTTHGQGASAVPGPEHADAFLDSLTAQDFARLGGALAARARLRGLTSLLVLRPLAGTRG